MDKTTLTNLKAELKQISNNYLIAQSGEYFYTIDNKIYRKDNKTEFHTLIEGYKKQIANEKYILSQFIHIQVGNLKLKLLVANRETVMHHINNIKDFNVKIETMERYFTQYEEVMKKYKEA